MKFVIGFFLGASAVFFMAAVITNVRAGVCAEAFHVEKCSAVTRFIPIRN